MEIAKNIWKSGQICQKGCDSVAHLEIEGIDAWDDILKELSHPEKITKDAVNEAAKILEKTTQAAVKASSNSGRLAKSFTRTPAKENSMGVYSVVRPTGDFELKGGKTMSNADLAAQFEYGRKGGYKRHSMKRAATTMKPKPWRQSAINSAKAACEAMVEQKVNEAVDKIVGG